MDISGELIKIGLAVLVGGLIGAEREFRDKAAGFRTIIFISVGATLFTILSSLLAGDKDPTRVAANIVTGIGFLGAGAILRESGRVAGLTTAATIWLAAALGMGIGGGYFVLVGASTVTILLVLWIFPHLELWIDNISETRSYKLHFSPKGKILSALNKKFKTHSLKIYNRHLVKTADAFVCTWTVHGTPKKHENLIQDFLSDKDIVEFDY